MAKKTKSGNPNMRFRENVVADSVATIESGIKSLDKAIQDLPKNVQKAYAPLISAQLQVNKLLKEEEESRDGIYTSLLEGIGLRTTSKDIEKAQAKVRKAIVDGNEKDLKVAQEALKLLGQNKKLQEELVEDFEGMFPGLVSGIKGIQKAFRTLNMIISKSSIFSILLPYLQRI